MAKKPKRAKGPPRRKSRGAKAAAQAPPKKRPAKIPAARTPAAKKASPQKSQPQKSARRLPPPRIRKPILRPPPPRLRSRGPYDALPRVAANFQPLTPLTMLERAAHVFPGHTAIIHGKQRFSYREFYRRCVRLASALAGHGIGKNDTVAAMLANTPAMLEAHYGVPMAGAVLNALNTRLDARSIAFMLEYGGAKLLLVDREFSATAAEALRQMKNPPPVIDYDDPEFPQAGERLGEDYEALLEEGDPEFAWALPADEWDAISLNFTSGTTGSPKGVVYHHRGAALMGFGNVLAANMGRHPVMLWTLPMFHCNGWCFPWSLSVVAGTHVCLRWVRPKAIYQALVEHGVTHLCGAPIVMSTILDAGADERRPFAQRVTFLVAAAPPPESVLAGMTKAGFDVVHVYGLTEVYGPAVVNEWQTAWDQLDSEARTARLARQGVRYHTLEGLSVLDPKTMEPPLPGQMGEVMFRGNIVMKGYLKNPEATREAFRDGWFHSGDLGVMHEDGYIQLKDRSKDIIISGGENISSIEIENVLMRHPAVKLAAVVARPDEKWGETPCAFVEKRSGHEAVTEEEILAFCRGQLAHYKAPRHLVFSELPKTSTGKIQKFALREQAKNL